MGRSKIYALVAAAFITVPSAAAFAADIPEVPPPVHFGGGWYLRGDIGMAQQGFHGLEHPDFADPLFFEWLNPGQFAAVPTFQVGIGYQHSEHIRFDLTGQYRGRSSFDALDRYDTDSNPPNFDGTPGPDWGTNHYTGMKSEWLFLANGYYDFNSWRGITPYVGAGVGMSYNTIDGFRDENVPAAGGGFAPTGHQWSFAWALHAGAAVQLSNNVSLDLGYSFVSLGDAQTGEFQNDSPLVGCTVGVDCTSMKFKGLYSHDFKLGVRWAFDAPQQSYYPPVVKY
jgi:opacity protein-like surface antigen